MFQYFSPIFVLSYWIIKGATKKQFQVQGPILQQSEGTESIER